MTWIASCLADALHYSHARGLVHMDIKPSNVLITMDGQPMLLDFHLARGPILAGERGAVRLGGTPGWMSPEQEQAMTAIREGRPVPLAVDGRSDIFALGLLLGEAIEQVGRPNSCKAERLLALMTAMGIPCCMDSWMIVAAHQVLTARENGEGVPDLPRNCRRGPSAPAKPSAAWTFCPGDPIT